MVVRDNVFSTTSRENTTLTYYIFWYANVVGLLISALPSCYWHYDNRISACWDKHLIGNVIPPF